MCIRDSNLTGLAGGAAVAGCCAQMVGFAVMSFKENGVGGLVSQADWGGLAYSTLFMLSTLFCAVVIFSRVERNFMDTV